MTAANQYRRRSGCVTSSWRHRTSTVVRRDCRRRSPRTSQNVDDATTVIETRSRRVAAQTTQTAATCDADRQGRHDCWPVRHAGRQLAGIITTQRTHHASQPAHGHHQIARPPHIASQLACSPALLARPRICQLSKCAAYCACGLRSTRIWTSAEFTPVPCSTGNCISVFPPFHEQRHCQYI